MIFQLKGSKVLGNEQLETLKGRIEALEKRLTWIERLLMTEVRAIHRHGHANLALAGQRKRCLITRRHLIARSRRLIDFLRTIGANPERKLDDVSKELGMTSNTAFRWLQEFIENAVMTDNEPYFPRKLLLFYNKGLPENEEGLVKSDVDQFRVY